MKDADNTFIILSRSLIDSDVFASPNLLKVWIWCLCRANYKERFYPLKIGKGFITLKINRGSFIYGRNKAADILQMSGSTVDRQMKLLKEKKMIYIKVNNQYSVITICKYDYYQDAKNYIEQPTNNLRTTYGQPTNLTRTSDEQPTDTDNTINKLNKVNNKTNEEIPKTEISLPPIILNPVDEISLNAKPKKEKNVAQKKEKEIKPDWFEFFNYANQESIKLADFVLDENKVRTKFEAWKANDWRTCGDNPKEIKSWKSTLWHSLKYCGKEKTSAQRENPKYPSLIDNDARILKATTEAHERELAQMEAQKNK